MNIISGLNTKTALEHLIFLSGQNIVEVCRALNLTPQQFCDWIKKRRPIPAGRLNQLAAYFGVPTGMLADGSRFAQGLSALGAVEMEMLIVAWETKICTEPAERLELAYRTKVLKEEHERQLRIAKLSALLEKNDPALVARIDGFLDELEQQ
jgi:hypothetical protein